MEEGDNKARKSVEAQWRDLVDLLTEVQALGQEAGETVIAIQAEIGRLRDELTALRAEMVRNKRQSFSQLSLLLAKMDRRGFW